MGRWVHRLLRPLQHDRSKKHGQISKSRSNLLRTKRRLYAEQRKSDKPDAEGRCEASSREESDSDYGAASTDDAQGYTSEGTTDEDDDMPRGSVRKLSPSDP